MFHFETLVGSSIRLAVIADDITGAFDTGVQFSKRGSRVSVATGAQICEPISGADVLVLDAIAKYVGEHSPAKFSNVPKQKRRVVR